MPRKVLSLLAVLVAALMWGAGPAQASFSAPREAPSATAGPARQDAAAAANPTWLVLKTQELTCCPDVSMPPSCVEESLQLAYGRYNWGRIWHLQQPWRLQWGNLELYAGTYTMKTCLFPRGGYYIQDARLTPHNPGLEPISWNVRIYPQGGARDDVTWGAFLDPLF